MTQKIIVGADEASRGLIIGPMVIAGCAITEKIGSFFRELGIKDSKDYRSLSSLKKHADIIEKKALATKVKIISADVLTNFKKNGMSLDEAEAYGFYRVLENITKKLKKVDLYQVDNFQAVKSLKSLISKNPKTTNVKLIVLPKADEKFVAVSAASILARKTAIEELTKIQKKYGEIGSGSTSDKRTISWLRNYYRKNKSWPEKIVRTTWKTIDTIEQEEKETK
ncbi:MAG: ribonuclease HII [Asgard group archaeon]|nr:ribonuclease HII [Asgard group archaeon]